jgi:SAM-dependent methyltransferase
VDGSVPASILDYGCGYGALARFLIERDMDFSYTGFDAAEEMILAARSLTSDRRCGFTANDAELDVASYTLASGIFNVKLDAGDRHWRAYVATTLDAMASHSAIGFGFNMLTRFADADMMRPDLYYADPMFYFALCKERYSRNVALLHDYDLYEFTILVQLGAPAKAFVPST